MSEIVFVVARAKNGIIGRGGAMPWRLPSELQHFKQTTWGRPMIMGRETFASVGKALPGRDTIVVTRDRAFAAPGVVVAHSIEAALRRAETCAAARGVNEIMVVGGAEIYAALLDRADRIVMTEVDLEPTGDAATPAPDPALWRLASTQKPARDPRDEAAYEIRVYERLRPASPTH